MFSEFNIWSLVEQPFLKAYLIRGYYVVFSMNVYQLLFLENCFVRELVRATSLQLEGGGGVGLFTVSSC